MEQNKIVIGIDCGVNTGFAVWSKSQRKFLIIGTLLIHQALKKVEEISKDNKVSVVVEDARQAVFGRANMKDSNKIQGAGSVKRDAKIWEDFLTDIGIEFRMVRPKKSLTKIDSDLFKKMTGWGERTSSHARDAAMMVYGT